MDTQAIILTYQQAIARLAAASQHPEVEQRLPYYAMLLAHQIGKRYLPQAEDAARN